MEHSGIHYYLLFIININVNSFFTQWLDDNVLSWARRWLMTLYQPWNPVMNNMEHCWIHQRERAGSVDRLSEIERLLDWWHVKPLLPGLKDPEGVSFFNCWMNNWLLLTLSVCNQMSTVKVRQDCGKKQSHATLWLDEVYLFSNT